LSCNTFDSDSCLRLNNSLFRRHGGLDYKEEKDVKDEKSEQNSCSFISTPFFPLLPPCLRSLKSVVMSDVTLRQEWSYPTNAPNPADYVLQETTHQNSFAAFQQFTNPFGFTVDEEKHAAFNPQFNGHLGPVHFDPLLPLDASCLPTVIAPGSSYSLSWGNDLEMKNEDYYTVSEVSNEINDIQIDASFSESPRKVEKYKHLSLVSNLKTAKARGRMIMALRRTKSLLKKGKLPFPVYCEPSFPMRNYFLPNNELCGVLA